MFVVLLKWTYEVLSNAHTEGPTGAAGSVSYSQDISGADSPLSRSLLTGRARNAPDPLTHSGAGTFYQLIGAETAHTRPFSQGWQVVFSTFMPLPSTGATVFFPVVPPVATRGHRGYTGEYVWFVGCLQKVVGVRSFTPRVWEGGAGCWLGAWDCI